MLFGEIIALYYENNMKPINTLCGQDAEFLTVKAGGTNGYQWAVKVKLISIIVFITACHVTLEVNCSSHSKMS
jgi:hypothetical protein